jgi:hypothetical protein
MSQQTIDYRAVLSDLQAQLEQKRGAAIALQEQVAALEAAIEKLPVGLGLGLEEPLLPLVASPIGVALSESARVSDVAKVGLVTEITPRAFRHLGLKPAIRQCLDLMGYLRSTGVVVRGLRAGGFQSTAENLPKSVSQALVRMWKDGEVTRTTDNLWGLPKWGAVPNPMPTNGNVAA